MNLVILFLLWPSVYFFSSCHIITSRWRFNFGSGLLHSFWTSCGLRFRSPSPSRCLPLLFSHMRCRARYYLFFFFFFILRRMGKNKALAHHTSTYFHTRRMLIQLSCFRSPTLAGAPFGSHYITIPAVPRFSSFFSRHSRFRLPIDGGLLLFLS